ncbi:maleylpyruvate isomerase family mycothiol-dependent enzyme [Modestobacter lapidis]|nr:maleylpyruvate isomerase family mycothiol-dependent enzyme [Modestobacter lapidis]
MAADAAGRGADDAREAVLTDLGLQVGAPDPAAAGEGRRRRDWAQLIADLHTLTEDTVEALAALDRRDGDRPSACAGWTVTDVVTHLALGDQDAVRALRGERWAPAGTDADAEIDRRVRGHGRASLEEATALWRQTRTSLLGELRRVDPADRFQPVEWAVQPISRLALAQSRAMETWIHGWDCSAAGGRRHVLDDRAYWVADLGVRSLAYAIHRAGLPPTVSVSMSLGGPAGGQWQRNVGSGADPAAVEGEGWAWVALCSRRVAPGPLRPFLRTTGSAVARSQLDTARAFV